MNSQSDSPKNMTAMYQGPCAGWMPYTVLPITVMESFGHLTARKNKILRGDVIHSSGEKFLSCPGPPFQSLQSDFSWVADF